MWSRAFLVLGESLIFDLLLEGDRVPPQVRPLPLDGHRTVQDWERVGSACGLIFVDACTWTV